MIDRRFDVRVNVEAKVSLSWKDQSGQESHRSAHLADISPSGASVRAQHPVKIGTILLLGHEDREYAGKVKSCVSVASGYLLGIEFEPGYRWAPHS